MNGLSEDKKEERTKNVECLRGGEEVLTIEIHSKKYSILVWHLDIWLTAQVPRVV